MKFLFYGGSFDPPHIGHLILPRDVMEAFGFDKVVFIPAYISPFKVKQGHRASAGDRLQMLKLAIEGVPYYGIETYEVDKKGISYTYETVSYLMEKYKQPKVFWLMGDDTFLSFHRWFRWKDLLKVLTPVVMVRFSNPDEIKNYALNTLGLNENELLTFGVRRLDISSTEVRERIKKGKDVRFMVPDRVYRYINERGLYKEKKI